MAIPKDIIIAVQIHFNNILSIVQRDQTMIILYDTIIIIIKNRLFIGTRQRKSAKGPGVAVNPLYRPCRGFAPKLY